MSSIFRCLTIAGSDPSGGAGIQGDLKTFAAHGQYGMAVITALTAQNTTGVQGVHEVPAKFVALQLESIFSDMPPHAIKTGMLATTAMVQAVSQFLRHHVTQNIIVDPVMVASSGAKLIADDAISAYINDLIPIATLVTPNVHEARILSGVYIDDLESAKEAARRIVSAGAAAVLVKGGDWPSQAAQVIDVLYDGREYAIFEGTRCKSRNTHGTGCALSSAICCQLANGHSMNEAVGRGIQYVRGALQNAYDTGNGTGSLNHFWPQ